jgi:hypothetical protein
MNLRITMRLKKAARKLSPGDEIVEIREGMESQ